MLVHDCSWRHAVVGGEAGQFAKPAIGLSLELAVCSRATGTGALCFVTPPAFDDDTRCLQCVEELVVE
jgi:hypothetical protein